MIFFPYEGPRVSLDRLGKKKMLTPMAVRDLCQRKKKMLTPMQDGKHAYPPGTRVPRAHADPDRNS
eukprot:3340640-Rhodomonas_salina.2